MKNDHLVLAANAVAQGDAFYAKAAKHMLAAREEGATEQEIADAVGKSRRWVRTTLDSYLKAGQPDALAVDWQRGSHGTTAELVSALTEKPAETIAKLTPEAKAKLAVALYHDQRPAPLSPAETRERQQGSEAAIAPLDRAVNSFAASVGTVSLIDRATNEINEAVSRNGLNADALLAIEQAIERLVAAVSFAKTMGGVA